MTFNPATAADRGTSSIPAEGVLARMIRLWVEHHRRMIELGIRPY